MLPSAQRALEDVVESRPADLDRRRTDKRTLDSKCAKAAAPGGIANANGAGGASAEALRAVRGVSLQRRSCLTCLP